MPDLSSIDKALSSISAPPSLKTLLHSLHTQALLEPPYSSTDSQPASAALERFVALDPDKCAFLYLLLRTSNAHVIVEAGTSFGLSTIYLALAASQNGAGAKVIGTEIEEVKADRAREHWRQAGDVGRCIELRVGDLRETLREVPEGLDCLLLDIWAVLALPALKLVMKKFRRGALVVADNVDVNREAYAELMAFLRDERNGFRTMTTPFEGGLEVAVYVGV